MYKKEHNGKLWFLRASKSIGWLSAAVATTLTTFFLIIFFINSNVKVYSLFLKLTLVFDDYHTAFNKTLGKLNREQRTTIVIVTHDGQVASMASRILFLSDGKLKAKQKQGKHQNKWD